MTTTNGADSGFTMHAWLDALAAADTLNFKETRVLLAMSRYATYATGRDVRPSMSTLCEMTGVSRGNIMGAQGAVGQLVDKGWLVRTAESTRTTPAVYALTIGSHRHLGGTQNGDHQDVGSDEKVVPATGTPGSQQRGPHDTGEGGPSNGDHGGPSNGDHGGPSNGDHGGPSNGDHGGPSNGDPTYPIPTQDLPIDLSPRDASDAATVDAEVVEVHDGEAEPATLDLDTTNPEPQPPAAPAAGTAVARNSMDDAIDACEKLAEFLAGRVAANTGTNVRPTKAWTQAMSALMAQGATPQDIARTIDYATKDRFWSGQIVNPTRLSAHYLQLASKARADGRPDLGRDTRPAWAREKDRVNDALAQMAAEKDRAAAERGTRA